MQNYTKVICIKDNHLYSLKVGDICYIDYNIEGYNDDGDVAYHMMMDKNRDETIFILGIENYFEDFSEYRNKRIEDIFA